jgi:hypothetical protein
LTPAKAIPKFAVAFDPRVMKAHDPVGAAWLANIG